MPVKKYSIKKSGDARLSANFRVKEFASHDGADTVYIDDELIYLLQGIRNHFRRPVVITSGYRTAAYNKAIGGSASSNHTKGLAADIQVKGVHPVLVAMYAEELRAGGIGLYAYSDGGFCHIDTRAVKYRWLCTVRGGKNEQVARQLPTLKIGGASNTFNSVLLLQRTLGVSQSGTFGNATEAAVKNFQKWSGLKADGIAGVKTWTELFN